MRIFQIDPMYSYLYRMRSVSIETGITALVGCNGAGKSTLLNCIREVLEDTNTPYIFFDNLCDGRDKARQCAMVAGDIDYLRASALSSEGENIVLNTNRIAFQCGQIAHQTRDAKELWILLDAIDSGLSIDNICDLKEKLFACILRDNQHKDVYIVVSANEYELCRGEQCFDVQNGKYITFEDYDAYRKYILKSRQKKEQREISCKTSAKEL